MTSYDSMNWDDILSQMIDPRNPNLHDSATSEAAYEANEQPLLPNHNQTNTLITMPNGSTKRKQELVSENSEAKGKIKKKQPRTSYIGESSASQQQPAEPKRKEERLKEFIKEKPVAQVIKIFKDRINRRIKNDKIAYVDALEFLSSVKKVFNLPLPMIDTLDQIRTKWSVRSDLEDINKRIEEIKSDYKKAAGLNSRSIVTDEIKQRLVEVEEALEKLDEQRQKDSIKTKNLEAIFTNNKEFSVETLREKFFAAFPFLRETATNGPTTTADQDQGSVQTREQSQSTFNSLESEVYAMDNNKVDVSNFELLKEALEKTSWGKTPNYLESIAIRIEKARGKATEVSHNSIQVLVCAAIQEMEDLQPENENFNRSTLKKWGATLNKAKELGFQVEFAEKLLRKNLYAYFGYSKVE